MSKLGEFEHEHTWRLDAAVATRKGDAGIPETVMFLQKVCEKCHAVELLPPKVLESRS